MKVISFLQSKGGVGKTTSVINVAHVLARNFNIAVVDTDQQASLINWNKPQRANFGIYAAESEKDIYTIRKSLNSFDYVLIDGAAQLSVITSASVMVSDLVIIPVSPSPLDFNASGAVLDVIEAQSFSRVVPAKFLITKFTPGTTMGNLLITSIADAGQEAFRTRIHNRQSYVKSLLGGGVVFDTTDGAAKGEIEVLTKEFLGFIGTPL